MLFQRTGRAGQNLAWEEPALEVLVNKHRGDKCTTEVRISDFHRQSNKQRRGPQSLSQEGFPAGATVGVEAKMEL